MNPISDLGQALGAGDFLRRGLIRTLAIEFHTGILQRRGLSLDELGRFITDCGSRYLGDFVYTWDSAVSHIR